MLPEQRQRSNRLHDLPFDGAIDVSTFHLPGMSSKAWRSLAIFQDYKC